uniref:Putative ornithine cyclodeaminase n=1 Tax=viral metagenome TaxID=1070528 RepID=A0A6H1Z990_9ZZZZ
MRVIDEMHGTVVLSIEDINFLLNKIGWNKIISRVGETFIEEAYGRTICPPKTIIPLGKFNNDYRCMPSTMSKYEDFIGTKIISCCADCPEKFNTPLAKGIYLLTDSETQNLILMFDSNLTTCCRTASASATAVKYLTTFKRPFYRLGIIGCGQQALFHALAISRVVDIFDIYLYDLNKVRADGLATRLSDKFYPLVLSKEEVINNSDILITLTPTKEPHLFGFDLPSGRPMTICAVGGDSEEKIEWEPQVLTIVDHYCDSLEQVSHTGTVSRALRDKIIRKENLKSLGKLMIGEEKLDESKKIKFFISTGVATQDLCVAILLYENLGLLEEH